MTVFVFYKKDLKKTGVIQTDILQVEEEQLSDYEIGKKARKENNIEYCYQMEQDDPDECIYIVASFNQKKELCEEIQNEDIQKECYEYFIYQEIVITGDVVRCKSLIVNKFYQQCLDSFFREWDDIGNCVDFEGKEKMNCEDIINKKIAYKNNDVELCNSMSDIALSADCKNIIINKPKDSDSDGLSDSEERSYGTNPFKIDSDEDDLIDIDELSKYKTDPNNPDTDGDGYNDGDEVKNGYNPNGEGKL